MHLLHICLRLRSQLTCSSFSPWQALTNKLEVQSTPASGSRTIPQGPRRWLIVFGWWDCKGYVGICGVHKLSAGSLKVAG